MKTGHGGSNKKKIYEYGNYRDFLSDFYSCQKEKDQKFSFSLFSKLAGFKAKSFLKLIIQGKRNLTSESIEKLSVALKLNKDERQFFKNLVFLNQATSVDERQTYAGQLMHSREYKKLHPLSEAQYNYLSQWYFVAIRELVGLSEFQEDPHWISSRLSPTVSIKDVQTALAELLKLGLIKRNEAGRLVLTDTDIATPDEVVSAYAAQYHREMLNKAKESIDRFKRDMREISAVTLCMSSERVEKIKEIIHKCRRDIIELTTGDAASDSVYQLNFQLFPLAMGIKAERKE